MRVAAVAFVLIVGAAVVLAFANTLNSWVLGGLLGGLAAILLCIPISLAIFTLLTRRQEARQRAAAHALDLDEEADYADAVYEDNLMVYEVEGSVLPVEDDLFADPRARYLPTNRHVPVSGYLPLPPVEHDLDFYEDDEVEQLEHRDPRSYPRQPRYPARALSQDELTPAPPMTTTGTTRRPATRSLAQHQSAALRKARQEAQQQQRLAQKRGGSGSLTHRSQGSRSASTQRPRTSHSLRRREQTSDFYEAEDEYQTLQQSARSAWNEAEDFSTEELREQYQQYPRRPAYPRNPRGLRAHAADPWTGELDGEDEQEEEPRSRRSRRDPERLSGSLRNPLVRRAPYLYEDDALHEEFARQLDHQPPLTRRSSLYEHYRNDEED